MSRGQIKYPRSKCTALDLVTEQLVSVRGKTVLITGANSGIGLETARALAQAGAEVVLACRSEAAAAAARRSILAGEPEARLSWLALDLSSLASVKAAAAEFRASARPLHVLLLNAGVINPPHRVTDDGFETTWQVNHLAHFLLVEELEDLLVAAAPSRIIVVSSDAHRCPDTFRFMS